MNPSVLNVVLYLFEHCLEDYEDAPPRATLEQMLYAGGFPAPKVKEALDWLEALAASRETTEPGMRAAGAERVFNGPELSRLSREARGLLLYLEQIEVLGPGERELAIERALALDETEVGLDEMKWVVLLTLFHQPGQEAAYARMEDILHADAPAAAH